MNEIRNDSVNGVAVRWIEAPPPYVATLMFRVGPIDEQLKTSGITHLTEHLALDPLHDREHVLNGAVHLDTTEFWAVGSREQTTRFINDLSKSLSEPTTSRLEAEARVLAAESHTRHSSLYNAFLTTWYGPNGPGLAGMEEFGLEWIGPTHIGAWVSRFFTAENAILTLTGPPDPALRLPLPRRSLVAPTMPTNDVGFRPEEPTLLTTQDAGICLGSVVKRSVPLLMAIDIAERRLRDRLRHDLGLVYAVGATYQPLSPEEAFVFVATEFEPQRAQEAGQRFLEILRGFADEGPSPKEVRSARRDPVNESVDPTAFAKAELNRLAHDELAGHPRFTRSQGQEIRNRTTAAEIREAFSEMMRRVLVIAPEGVTDGLAIRHKANHQPFEGKRFRARLRSNVPMRQVVVGVEGVSGFSDGRWVSIPYRDLILVTRPEPGARRLYSRTGSWIEVGASDWRNGTELVSRLDAGLAPGTMLPVRRSAR